MPVTGFICPQTQNVIPLDEAAAYFEEAGLIPADVVQTMIDDIRGSTHARGTQLSPSKMDPETNCRREIVGTNYMDYTESPFDKWAALEGTVFHWGMVEAGKGLPDWKANVKLPPRGPNGERVQVELFPGIMVAGEGDRIKDYDDNTFIIADHKTSRYSKTDYGPKNIPSWAIQVNLYRYIYEDMTGRTCKELYVWRTYRGSYEKTRTFRKFPIPLISREKLWAQIGPWVESLRDYLMTADAVKNDPEEVKALVSSIPMDGYDKQMFNGKKCTGNCGFYRTCFGLAGKVVF